MINKTKYDIHINLISKVCVCLVVLICITSLYSYLINQISVANFGGISIPMAPSTAIFFIIITIDIILNSKIKRFARFVEKVVLISISVVSMLIVLERIFGFNYGIEHVFPNNNAMYLGTQLWKMSPITGVCFVLIVVSLQLKLFFVNSETADKIFTISQLIVGAIAATIIIGYGYKTPFLYGGTIIPVALSSGICFFLLTIAVTASFGNNTRIIKAFNGTTITSNLIRTILPITVIGVIGMGLIEIVFTNFKFFNQAIFLATSLIAIIIILNGTIIFAVRKIGSVIDSEIKKRLISEQELKDSNCNLEEVNSQLEEEIAERIKVEDELAYKTAELERFFNINLDLLCIADLNGNFLKVNNAWSEILGYPKSELENKNFQDFVHPEDKEATLNAISRLGKNEQVLYFVNRFKCIDNTYRYIEWCSQPYGNLIYAAARDITERKRAEEEIIYLSYHDKLTGLYNRRFYEEELKRLDIERNLPITLVMGDVNGLKLINDSFGHVMGDDLLKKIAEVIKKGCRADDIIARLGGDEFVIILPKTDVFEAEKIIKRIKNLALTEKAGTFDISVSFGYSTKNNKEEEIQKILKIAEDHMYSHKLYESLSMRSKTIDIIMNTLYEKSNREMLHSKRVSESCEAIATMLNFDKDDINQIKIAGLMHDIGKMGIDEKILNKEQGLNNDEWNEIKRHPEIGYRILSSVNEFSEIAEYVLEHQERWDGKGYPKGLKGEEISLQARIIAVADAFDAMTSERSYRRALSEEVAINELQKNSGTQFDPNLVCVFIEKVLGKIRLTHLFK